MTEYERPMDNHHSDGRRKRCDTIVPTHSKSSLVSSQTVVDLNTVETMQQRRRSLRHVPSFSTMVRSTSSRSIQSTVTMDESSSKPRLSFASRRQSLTRATASSLAKMVNFSANNATSPTEKDPPAQPQPSMSTKKKSKFNSFLHKKGKAHQAAQGPETLPSPPETPRPNAIVTHSISTTITSFSSSTATTPRTATLSTGRKSLESSQRSRTQKHRASWSPFGLLRPAMAEGNEKRIGSPTSPCSSSSSASATSPSSSSSSLKKACRTDSGTPLSPSGCSLDTQAQQCALLDNAKMLSTQDTTTDDGALSSLVVFERAAPFSDYGHSSSLSSNLNRKVSDPEIEPLQPPVAMDESRLKEEKGEEEDEANARVDGATGKGTVAMVVTACEQQGHLSNCSSSRASLVPSTSTSTPLSSVTHRRRPSVSFTTAPNHSMKRRSMLCSTTSTTMKNHALVDNKRHSTGAHDQSHGFQVQHQQPSLSLMRKSKCVACTRHHKNRRSTASISSDTQVDGGEQQQQQQQQHHHHHHHHHHTHTRQLSTVSVTPSRQHSRTNSRRGSVTLQPNLPSPPQSRSPMDTNANILDSNADTNMDQVTHVANDTEPININNTKKNTHVANKSLQLNDQCTAGSLGSAENGPKIRTPLMPTKNGEIAEEHSWRPLGAHENNSKVDISPTNGTDIRHAPACEDTTISINHSLSAKVQEDLSDTSTLSVQMSEEEVLYKDIGDNEQKPCVKGLETVSHASSASTERNVVISQNKSTRALPTCDGQPITIPSLAIADHLSSRLSGDHAAHVTGTTVRTALAPTEQEDQQSLFQLVARCMVHADKLEHLALELTRSESSVTTLLQAHETLISALDAREHRYMQHVETYRQLLSSQARMLEQLEDLLHRSNDTSVPAVQESATAATPPRDSMPTRPPPVVEPPALSPAWYCTPVSSHVRWHVSRYFGTTASTGDIVSRQQDHFGRTTDIVVSGTCVVSEPSLVPQHLILSPHQASPQETHDNSFHHHHYRLHITRKDRMEKFTLMPTQDWIPDADATHCQWTHSPPSSPNDATTQLSCPLQFNWLHRRHHCRRCGHVFCQKHSTNQLPLFNPLNPDRGEWARVCDSCFYRLLTNISS